MLVPVATNYLGLRGLQLLLRSIQMTQAQINRDLQILGIVGTMYDRRVAHHGEVLQELRRALVDQDIRVFETVIPRRVRFEEAAMTGKPVVGYIPHHAGADAYQPLMKEMIAGYGH